MRKIGCIGLIIMLLLSCTACQKEPLVPTGSIDISSETNSFSSSNDAYEYQLNAIRQTISTTELANYWRYFYQDLDGNGIDELCVVFEGSEFKIYTFVAGSVTLVGTKDYYTGTLRCFASEENRYPGIFTFTCGNSADHYGYLTIKDGELHDVKIWQDRYVDTPNTREEIRFVTDDAMIEESKKLYQHTADILLLNF